MLKKRCRDAWKLMSDQCYDNHEGLLRLLKKHAIDVVRWGQARLDTLQQAG